MTNENSLDAQLLRQIIDLLKQVVHEFQMLKMIGPVAPAPAEPVAQPAAPAQEVTPPPAPAPVPQAVVPRNADRIPAGSQAAARMLDLRKKLGLTQGDMAQRLDYSKGTIAIIEGGHSPISRRMMKAIRLLEDSENVEPVHTTTMLGNE